MWAKNQPIPGRLCESLRLYALCKGMKFTHLPEPGGLYDQHPKLLDDWDIIMKAEAEEAKRQRDATTQGTRKPATGRKSGKRRR